MTVPPARGHRPRVLLADCDPVSRAWLAAFLHRRRFDVAAAASGREGRRALSSFAPALCVIDLFPRGRMTGMGVAEGMHRRDAGLQLTFLTPRRQSSCAERPALLESAPLLHNPMRLDELGSTLWRVLLPQAHAAPTWPRAQANPRRARAAPVDLPSASVCGS